MKKRNDKRKIYKYKYKPKKKRKQGRVFRKILSVLVTIVVLCGLVFLGYTIAAPLLRLIDKNKSEQTVETTEISDTQILSETLNTESESVSVLTEDISETDDTTEKIQKNKTDALCAVTLDEESLDSLDSLNQAISLVKLASQNYEITDIVVPLKVQGGQIKYASENKNAQLAGAVDSTLTLDEIYSAIADAGFYPCAQMSLLYDSVYPSYNINASYVTESGSRWIDNDINAGGKTWLDPSKEDCVVYLQSLLTEITSAGFQTVLCTDVVFPEFRESDVEYLGEEVVAEDRYKTLVSLIDELEKTAEKNNALLMLETDISGYISGDTKQLVENSTSAGGIVFDISVDELTSSAVEDENGKVYDYTSMEKDVFIASLIDDFNLVDLNGRNVVFNLKGDDITDNEKIAILAEIQLLGYKSYILN
jgi:hypothetical protein